MWNIQKFLDGGFHTWLNIFLSILSGYPTQGVTAEQQFRSSRPSNLRKGVTRRVDPEAEAQKLRQVDDRKDKKFHPLQEKDKKLREGIHRR